MTDITIKKAAVDLGIAEDAYRFMLADFMPDNFESVSKVPLDVADLVVKALQAKTEGQALAPIADDSSLSIKEQQSIISGVNNTLADFCESIVIESHNLTTAIAFIAAKRNAANFRHTYESVFSDEVGKYVDELSLALAMTAQKINDTTPNDFLSQRGITPRQPSTSKAVEEILNLAANI